jgi:biotin operon repressor
VTAGSVLGLRYGDRARPTSLTACQAAAKSALMDERTRDTSIALLQAAGVAQAANEPLDLAALASELDMSEQAVGLEIEQLEAAGLMLTGQQDHESPLLLDAGRQFLAAGGEVSWDVLDFLPRVIDDLHARQALIHGGVVLVDEFRYQHLNGDPAAHAAELVPPAFSEAVDEALALDLFAAAVALMARLSDGLPAGCVAEEILAVRLIEHATVQLETRADNGELTEAETSSAVEKLRGLFELFEDDDVLNMFDMEEPADAALAGHDRINVQMGVADQRVENWFKPFGGTTPTGYLSNE